MYQETLTDVSGASHSRLGAALPGGEVPHLEAACAQPPHVDMHLSSVLIASLKPQAAAINETTLAAEVMDLCCPHGRMAWQFHLKIP
jgi:hypothetical protein